MKEHYFSVIKFPVFVSLSLIILLGTFFGVAWSSYHQLGLSMINTVIYTVVFVSLILLISTWMMILLSTHQKLKSRAIRIYCKWMLFNIYYYLAKWLSAITFQNKVSTLESFLHFNNEIVLTNNTGIEKQNILVLLPHCLQNSECKIRITTEVNDCLECGKCDIAAIKKMVSNYQVKTAVATGGSLARKLIKDISPDVIIAVACHRDLSDGVRESWRFPVYALLNERPNGPCFDTIVSVKAIEFAIKKFL